MPTVIVAKGKLIVIGRAPNEDEGRMTQGRVRKDERAVVIPLILAREMIASVMDDPELKSGS